MRSTCFRIYCVLVLVSLWLGAALALLPTGCTSGIPIFDQHARLLNRVASAEELLTQVNHEVGTARRDGVITQHEIDRLVTPNLDKAEAIIKATRVAAHAATQPATTQPTTRPAGTIDDARQLLLGVRSVLQQLRGTTQ